VDITVDMKSADFGQDQLNKGAQGKELFESNQYPQATYTGKLADFVDGAPTRVVGKLTMHGVTRPLDLKIDSFKCMPHPMLKREVCGADALATFKRDAFGMAAGKDYGFKMDVTLRIQVEAIAAK
jgi:polyisoprenoid-binding protein YceI